MDESLEVIKITIETTINSIIENANLLVFDKIALFLSFVAIAISIWSVYRNEALQYKNKFFDGVLLEPLRDKLPKLIKKAINIEMSCVDEEGCAELEQFIKDFRSEILVFKYVDKEFYDKIDSELIKIDEILILMNNRNESFNNKYEELLREVGNLYKDSKKYIC